MFKKSNALQTLHEKELEKSKENSLMYLSIDIVHENPENDTLYVSELHDKEFRALKEDIREIGIKQPLLVKLHPHLPLEYIVISGHRRLQAAKEIGLKKIPCMIDIIKDEKDKIRSEISLLTTNMLVRERTAFEKAKEIAKLKKIIETQRELNPSLYKGKTLDILAENLGMSVRQIKKYNKINLAMDQLDSNILEEFKNDKHISDITARLDNSNMVQTEIEQEVQEEKGENQIISKLIFNTVDDKPTLLDEKNLEFMNLNQPNFKNKKIENQPKIISKKNQYIYQALKDLEKAQLENIYSEDLYALKVIEEIAQKLIHKLSKIAKAD